MGAPAGRVEVTLSPALEPGFVTAAWLVGTEESSPRDCAEICLVELELTADSGDSAGIVARTGLKAHGDSRLATEMVALDAEPAWRGSTTWTAQWGAPSSRLDAAALKVSRRCA